MKIWRLRNEGQESWPLGTVLEHVGGDSLATTTRVPVVSTVEPGSEVEIAVDMSAPERPGRYVSFWKLADSEGVRFGQRVWADICVEYEKKEKDLMESEVKTEDTEANLMDAEVKPELNNEEMAGKVKQLQDMGFGDLEMNRIVLEKHGMDMVKTVQELLSL